jgi:DNA-binding transcriptional ArsR family regulator
MVLTHLEWAGVDDSDLVADHYFKPSVQPRVGFELPEGRREDLRNYYSRFTTVVYSEALKHQTTAVYDILSIVAERHGATYDQLVVETGYSRSNIDYHVGRLRDVGLLTTVGNPAIVCFDAEYLYERTLELIEEEIAPHFDESLLSDRRLGREERAEERREQRESGEANGTDSPDDGDRDQEGDAADDSAPFIYLDQWDGSLLDLEHELESPDHPRDERDVRVRSLEPPE